MSMSESAAKLFGTNGVRGVVGRDLTLKMVLDLAQAIGTFFDRRSLLVGCDGRTTSPAIMNMAVAGLLSTGCDVRKFGAAPTPAIQFLTKARGFAGSVVVTASHNPPEYNGIKVNRSDGIEISREQEGDIESIYRDQRFRRANWLEVGKVVDLDRNFGDYIDSVMKASMSVDGKGRCLTLVVDCSNGVGGLTTPNILRAAGHRVITLNAVIDGRFPGHPPEPIPGNLKELCQVVKASKADFGVALDGDGDRAVFVDEKGVPHWGDRTFGLIADKYLSQHRGKTIVTPVSSSQLIEIIARKYGGKIEWTKVGSVNVSHRMIEIGADLGGEENGGILYAKHHPVRDGAMATALVAEIVAAGQPLSKLVARLPKFHQAKLKVECKNSAKERALRALAEQARGKRIERLDGLKIWFKDNSWVLVRPSGTEPAMRIFSESRSASQARKIALQYRRRIEHIIRDILS